MKSHLFLAGILVLLVGVAVPVGAAPPDQAQQDIVDIAVADGRFTTLVAAVSAADLVDTLKSEGPFTVFAPTDDAFDKLPAGTVESLLQDIPALTDILLYHVVGDTVMAADVINLSSADTVLGKSVNITVDGDKVMINDAQVIITDIEASNGVIHVIDAVLLPPAEAPAALPTTGGEVPFNGLLPLFLGLGLGLVLLTGGLIVQSRTAKIDHA
jgi:uncharacterized surface protein with fasciclin (FAS1) repeats